jgi:hypothetical protein
MLWPSKESSFLIIPSPSCDKKKNAEALERRIFLLAYKIQPVPHPMHFNPKDGGCIFFWNVRIHLQDCTMLQLRQP